MLQQHLILAFFWLLFGVLHSALATTRIKKVIATQSPSFFKNFRFFYTLFAFVSMGLVLYYQFYIPSPFTFHPNLFTQISGIVITLTGGVIMLVCIKKYFLSLSGLKSLVAEQTVANELRIDGIHRFIRHPLYLGTFLFIWGAFLLWPYLSLCIANIIITSYTLIAIRFEEQKLIAEFGESYKRYREMVPALVPRFRNFSPSN